MIDLRLKKEIIENMIETYEFLHYQNKKDKECKKILHLLKRSVLLK